MGAQLFCALVRSVGVDARLVCSLQPLPFQSHVKAKSLQTKETIAVDRYYSEEVKHANQAIADNPRSEDEHAIGVLNAIGSVGGRSRYASSDVPAFSSSDNSPVSKKSAASKTRRYIRCYFNT